MKLNYMMEHIEKVGREVLFLILDFLAHVHSHPFRFWSAGSRMICCILAIDNVLFLFLFLFLLTLVNTQDMLLALVVLIMQLNYYYFFYSSNFDCNRGFFFRLL